MIGRAACRGAATIVNAIATGKGAAFGISLETDVVANLELGRGEILTTEGDEGSQLVAGCVRAVASKAGKEVNGRVTIRSEIPISRGLKSSSAVSNAVGLATARALDANLTDMELIMAGIEESIKAGVTITGAFDDAAACYLGGVVVTNNRSFTILGRGKMDPDLSVVIHVPERQITKASIKGLDFSPIRAKVEEAFDLAMKGSYMKAMELNSRAYARVLDVPEDAVEAARKHGALAAGISGTGPATVALCSHTEASAVVRALEALGGSVLRARINETPAPEVVPRLL